MRKLISKSLPSILRSQLLFQRITIKYSFSIFIPEKGKLQYKSEYFCILDFDDPFGLSEVEDIYLITNHLENNIQMYDFKELGYFLIRFSEEYQKNNSTIMFDLKRKKGFKMLINEIRARLMTSNHEKDPFLGTILYHLKMLDMRDKIIMQRILEKINDGNWKANYKESVKALQGTTDIFSYRFDPEFVDEALNQIEIAIEKTIWEENMLEYKKITDALCLTQRAPKALLFKIENHVTNNLAMEYSVETIYSILKNMAALGYGSKQFFTYLQIPLVKGHAFYYHPSIMNIRSRINNDGFRLCTIIDSFSAAKKMHPDLLFLPDFKHYLYENLVSSQTNFSIQDISSILVNLPCFEIDNQDEIEGFLIDRVCKIQDLYYNEILDFYTFVLRSNVKITRSLIIHFENEIMKNFDKESVDSKCIMFYFLVHQSLIVNKKEVLEKFIAFFNERIKEINQPQLLQIFSSINYFRQNEETSQMMKVLQTKCPKIFSLQLSEKSNRIYEI